MARSTIFSTRLAIVARPANFCCLVLVFIMVSGGCSAAAYMMINDRPAAINDDVKQAAVSSNRFGNQLARNLFDNGRNLFFSPASINTALSMAWRGAEAETADEIKSSLQIELPEGQHHAAIGEMIRVLNAQGKGFELRLANRLWGQTGFNFRQDFLEALQQDYRAPLALADFRGETEKSRQQINQWVALQTNQRIKDLFKPGILDPDTRLVLVNAIYFKAKWKSAFKKELTQNQSFRIDASQSVQVPMMQHTGRLMYGETDHGRLVRIPYENPELTMTVVLSKTFGQLKQLESDWLDPDSQIMNVMSSSREVTLQLPRFKIESEFRLDDALRSLGIQRAFQSSAQFGRISSEEPLQISAVVHKAFIDVNEEGTEAAAATGIAIRATAAPIDDSPVEFIVDQPFLFFIRHEPSGAVLFAGRVVNPQAK